MTLFISKLMNGIMELLIVSIIPFITWLIWSRKKVGFFDWIGLKKVESQKKRRLLLTILGISLLFLLFSIVVLSWFDSSQTATAAFSGKGMGALPAIMAYAILGTALPEEIFFRGFLLKRMQGKLGFLGANLVQSLLFGLIHALMFIQLTGYLKLLLSWPLSVSSLTFLVLSMRKKQEALSFQVSLSMPWPIRLQGFSLPSPSFR